MSFGKNLVDREKMERDLYNKMDAYEKTHWWFSGRRAIIKKTLDRYSQKKTQRIIEIGCGSGGNLRMLKQYGNLSAMELDDNAREIASDKDICHVKKGKLPDEIPFGDNFDLICMLDVCEHIEDDLAALQSVKEKLNSGGLLLITVPAYQFLWGSHDIANHHFRRYTRNNLVNIISGIGMIDIYSTYFNTFLFPIIGSIRIINNIFNIENIHDLNMPSKIINKLLFSIFSSEKIFIPNISFPFGVSILLIAKKI